MSEAHVEKVMWVCVPVQNAWEYFKTEILTSEYRKGSYDFFFGSRRHPPQLSSKGSNYQRGVLFISAGAIEGHFEGKTPREDHQGGSCSCTTMPRLTGHLQLRRNWPTWASSLLITHPFCGSGPVGLPPFPWTEKTIERSPFFVRRGGHCCRGDLVGRTNFWFFFEWLAKVRATG